MGHCNAKKVFFRNLLDRVETVSVELVGCFQNTCFHDSVRQSKAESRIEKMVA